MFYRIGFIFTLFLSLYANANELFTIKSFEATFNQEITNASNKKIIYTGQVFIKKEGKILWKYKTPIIKNVYVIKNIAIIDEPELEQVIYTQLQNDMNLIDLIKKSKKIEENLYVAQIENIDYYLYFENKNLQKVSYEDRLENSVEILFSNVKQNAKIQSDLFEFFPPEHYDIIRQ